MQAPHILRGFFVLRNNSDDNEFLCELLLFFLGRIPEEVIAHTEVQRRCKRPPGNRRSFLFGN